MTRINLVEPQQLTNKHLIAEYRELPRVFSAVRKLVNKPSPRVGDAWTRFIESNQIPHSYVLGAGHVKFFYNKLPWLRERYREICYELRTKRNVKLDESLRKSVMEDSQILIGNVNFDMFWEWSPSPEEIYLNMARICKRSKLPNVLNELHELE